jgi:hypothetical protein
MANRDIRLIIKNSDIVNRPLPTSLLKGESIVNTAEGIMYFSGVTTSTTNWTPAGTGTTSTFFEVGSNLYDLRLRNRITQYENINGSGLQGKFLSGTTNGFILADISNIQGVDSYVTGSTWTPNTLYIDLNNGKPSVQVTIDTFTDLNVTGTQNVNNLTITGTGYYNTTPSGTNPNELINYSTLTSYTQTNEYYVTGGTFNNNTLTLDRQNGSVTITGFTDYYVTGGTFSSGSLTLYKENGDITITGFTSVDTYVTGFTYDNSNNLTISRNEGQPDLSVNISSMTGLTVNGVLSATTYVGLPIDPDNYVTGGTFSNNTLTLDRQNGSVTITGFTDYYVTGGTFSSGTLTLERENGSVTITGFTTVDTYVTGFTYDNSNNLTISRNEGQPDLSVNISVMSGLTINGTLSATTYVGLPIDPDNYVTGGTFTNNTLTLDRQNGSVTITGFTDYNVTGGTFSNNTLTLNKQNGSVSITGFTDYFVTGGTFSSGTLTLNRQNGPITVTGITDTFVTGFTYDNSNNLTISRNQGQPNLNVNISIMSGLTVNGNLSVTGNTTVKGITGTSAVFSGSGSPVLTVIGSGTTLFNVQGSNGNIFTITDVQSGPIFEVNDLSNNPIFEVYSTFNTINYGSLNVSGNTIINSGLTASTLTISSTPTLNNSNTQILTRNSTTGNVEYSSISAITSSDSYVTGGTFSNNTLTLNRQNGSVTVTGFTDYFVTGGTYSSGTLTLNRQNGPVTITGLTSSDTYVTGFTYNNNTLTISRNQGQSDLSATINTLTGLSVSNLTSGQVVYAGSGGELKTDTVGEFAYNDSTNTLTIGTTSGNLVVNNGLSDGSVRLGQGGLIVGSNGSHSTPGKGDVIIHGNLTVFGSATTVSTNELYVEDPQITLNYNPSGNTYLTSISSGFRIQDGSGISGSSQDVFLTIGQMNTFSGTSGDLGSVVEYTGPDGYTNRAWVTQLNDIVVRNTNLNNGAPDGARVLVSGDILDSGTY